MATKRYELDERLSVELETEGRLATARELLIEEYRESYNEDVYAALGTVENAMTYCQQNARRIRRELERVV